MKTIGLIGGMSWESSLEYYRIFNETVKQRLGGYHSAQCMMYSVEFAEIEALMNQERWADVAQILIAAAARLEIAGADCVVIGTNTMHKLADEIQANIHIPLLHIVDAVAAKIQAAGLTKVGLLGTRFTMEHDFYKRRLQEKFGMEVLVPTADERAVINQVIFDELCMGVISEESRKSYAQIMERLVQSGAQGIILGCTEIELLVRQEDCRAPVYPTTRIHAEAAVEWALS